MCFILAQERREHMEDKNTVFSAFVTNLGKYNEGCLIGKWVEFPTTQEVMKEVLAEIGINEEYEEYFITDYDSNVTGLTDNLGEYENLSVLNYLAHRVQEEVYDIDMFESILEYGEHTGSAEELINLTYNLDSFYYMSDVSNDYDLGYAWVHNMGIYDKELKEMGRLADYIDFESYGRDIRIEEGGVFTDAGGYISMSDTFTEYFDSCEDEVPEEYRL